MRNIKNAMESICVVAVYFPLKIEQFIDSKGS